jgi:hypothetical protein
MGRHTRSVYVGNIYFGLLVFRSSITFLSAFSLYSTHIYLEEPSVVPYQWAISGSRGIASSEHEMDTRRLRRNTSSTTSIPPLSHLYLLRFFWCHDSNSFITADAPRFFPERLNTTHALGTFSSEVRPPETPATVTSLMSFSG